jgi:hypothetical protein
MHIAKDHPYTLLPDAVQRAQSRISSTISFAVDQTNRLHQAISSKKFQLSYLSSQPLEMQVEISVEFDKMMRALKIRRRELEETVQMMHEEEERKLHEALEKLEKMVAHMQKSTDVCRKYEPCKEPIEQAINIDVNSDRTKENVPTEDYQQITLPFTDAVELVSHEVDVRQMVEFSNELLSQVMVLRDKDTFNLMTFNNGISIKSHIRFLRQLGRLKSKDP